MAVSSREWKPRIDWFTKEWTQKPFDEVRGDKETRGIGQGKIAAWNRLVTKVFYKFTSRENQRIYNNQYLNLEHETWFANGAQYKKYSTKM